MDDVQQKDSLGQRVQLFARRLLLLVVAAVAPAYVLAVFYGFPVFFVLSSIALLLSAAALFVWQRRNGKRPSGWGYVAFTLALFLLIWQPMVVLHAQYAPLALAVVVNHLVYVIAGLVLVGLYFTHRERT
ncbi:MAG: hypothetical protein JXQ97_01160 [Natronospirillum sp.]